MRSFHDFVRKWKTKKYYNVELFQNPIEKSSKEAKLIPLAHKYMTDHFPGLVQARE